MQPGRASNLASNAFLSDITQLASDATKRKLGHAKDSLARCVASKCTSTNELWDALLLSVDAFPRTSKSALLAISSIGKMATLQLVAVESLPFACSVLRRLASISIQEHQQHSQSSASASAAGSGAGGHAGGSATTSGSAASVMASAAAAILAGGASLAGNVANATAQHANGAEEEFQLRIVQTIIAFVSACEVGRRWVEEPLGAIFYLYINTRSQLVQAACSAAIAQTAHSMLAALVELDQDGARLEMQAVAASFFRDVCRLSAGNTPSWLRIMPHEGGGVVGAGVAAAQQFVIPESLQLLLLDVLTSHFQSQKETLCEASPLFIQVLNEDLIALIIGAVTDTDGGCEGSSASKPSPSAMEIFTRTNKLALAVITRALPLLRSTLKIVLLRHISLIRSAIVIPDGGAAAVPALHRQQQQQQQQRPMASGGESSASRIPAVSPGSSSDGPTGEVSRLPSTFSGPPEWKLATLLVLWRKALTDYTLLAKLISAADAPAAEELTSAPIVLLLVAVADLLRNVLEREHGISASSPLRGMGNDGALKLSLSSTQQDHAPRSHGDASPPWSPPASTSPPGHALLPLLIDFCTMEAQTLNRLLEACRSMPETVRAAAAVGGGGSGGGGAVGASTITSSTAVVGVVSPGGESERLLVGTVVQPLIKACSLAIRLGVSIDDSFHAVLKTITHLVHCTCLVGFPRHRDALLGLLQHQLMPPHEASPTSAAVASVGGQDHLQKSGNRSPSSASGRHSPQSLAVHPSLLASGTAQNSSSHNNSNNNNTNNPENLSGSVLRSASPVRRSPSPRPATPIAPTVDPQLSSEELARRCQIVSQLASIASGIGNLLDEGWIIVLHCFVAFDHDIMPDVVADVHHMMHEKQSLMDAIAHIFSSSAFLSPAALELVADNLLMVGSRLIHASHSFQLTHAAEIAAKSSAAAASASSAAAGAGGPAQVAAAKLRAKLHAIARTSTWMASLCRSNAPRLQRVWPFASQLWLSAASMLVDCPTGIVEDAASIVVLAAKREQSTTASRTAVHSEGAVVADGGGSGEDTPQQLEPFKLLLDLYYSCLSASACTLVLREVHRALTAVSQDLRPASWCAVLKLLEGTTLKAVTVGYSVSTRGGNTVDYATEVAAAYEDVAFGYRTLEMIHHGSITSLGQEGLLAMIACVGEYIHFGGAARAGSPQPVTVGDGVALGGSGQRAPSSPLPSPTPSPTRGAGGGLRGAALLQPIVDRGINISLSAVQLAWSLADFLVAADGVDASPHHWNTLMLQLRDGCLDSRHEVRQSSVKTLFSLVITHGGLLPAECWGTCVWDVCIALAERINLIARETFQRLNGQSNAEAAEDSAKQRRAEAAEALRRAQAERASSGAGSSTPEWATPPQLQEVLVAILESIGRIMKLFHPQMAAHVPNYSAARERIHTFCTAACSVSPTGPAGRSEAVVFNAIRVVDMLLANHTALALSSSEVEALFGALEGIALSPACAADMDHLEKYKGLPASAASEAQRSPKVMCGVLMALTNFVVAAKKQSACAEGSSANSQGSNANVVPLSRRLPVDAYLSRLLSVLESSVLTQASVLSFMCPSQVQTQVMDELRRLLPILASESDWQAALNALLSQFPTLATVGAIVEQRRKQCARAAEGTRSPPSPSSVSSAGAAPATASTSLRELRELRDLTPKMMSPRHIAKLVEFLGTTFVVACPQEVLMYLSPQLVRALTTIVLLRAIFVATLMEERCRSAAAASSQLPTASFGHALASFLVAAGEDEDSQPWGASFHRQDTSAPGCAAASMHRILGDFVVAWRPHLEHCKPLASSALESVEGDPLFPLAHDLLARLVCTALPRQGDTTAADEAGPARLKVAAVLSNALQGVIAQLECISDPILNSRALLDDAEKLVDLMASFLRFSLTPQPQGHVRCSNSNGGNGVGGGGSYQSAARAATLKLGRTVAEALVLVATTPNRTLAPLARNATRAIEEAMAAAPPLAAPRTTAAATVNADAEMEITEDPTAAAAAAAGIGAASEVAETLGKIMASSRLTRVRRLVECYAEDPSSGHMMEAPLLQALRSLGGAADDAELLQVLTLLVTVRSDEVRRELQGAMQRILGNYLGPAGR